MTKKVPPDFNPNIAAEMEAPKIFRMELREGGSIVLHDNGVAFAEIKITKIRESYVDFLVFQDGAEMDIDSHSRFIRKHPMEPHPSMR